MSSEMGGVLVLSALFTAAFAAVEHRLNAPHIWQRSSLINVARVKGQTLHGSLRRRLAFVLLFVSAASVILWLPSRGKLQVTSTVALTAAWLCWEVCSVIWSVNARLSLRRLLPWIITVAIGFSAGASLGLERCVMVIALVCSAFLVAGVGNELFSGANDRQTVYRFAGTLHPNQQGFNCGMLAFSSCFLGCRGLIPSEVAIACVVAGVAGLALTRSRVAFWAAEAAALIWIAITPASSSRMWPLGLAGGILLAGMTFILFEGKWDKTLNTVVLFGRTSYANTLNGRTLLWRLLLSDSMPHWILGYGYGAFWDVPRMETIQAQTGLIVWNCHSTPLEILVRSGAVGAILFAATSLAAIIAALVLHSAGGAFLASMFVFVSLQGLLESFFALPSFGSLFLFLLLGTLAAA